MDFAFLDLELVCLSQAYKLISQFAHLFLLSDQVPNYRRTYNYQYVD